MKKENNLPLERTRSARIVTLSSVRRTLKFHAIEKCFISRRRYIIIVDFYKNFPFDEVKLPVTARIRVERVQRGILLREFSTFVLAR